MLRKLLLFFCHCQLNPQKGNKHTEKLLNDQMPFVNGDVAPSSRKFHLAISFGNHCYNSHLYFYFAFYSAHNLSVIFSQY